ncbi:alpha-tocopherol transfer protein-like [Cydia fagiglandana]|uniref:alpha-tocopherol transfer protein-like n=1 Tax=Cydia fagiglandana TaxID=1458189 RepID=UPI002FEE2281
MIRELPPTLAKIAKDELNENPKRTQEDVQHLKEWITKQPHLKARTDDQWLVAVLRGCKFSLERVKKKLDLYYTLRTTAPDVTLRLKPTENKFLEFLRLGTVIILPEATEKLSTRVILLRPGSCNPHTHNIADIMCVLTYLVQILVVESDAATVLGTKIVVDYQGVTMAHLAQANPTLLKKMIAVSQESTPLRSKGSHHVNLPAGIDAIFQLIKGLINAKARDRLKIHKNYEELREFIPQESLPNEYGGSGGSIAEITEYWVKKMAEYKSWMQLEETLGTDESRRAGAPRTAEEMFGADGSFRKLDFD